VWVRWADCEHGVVLDLVSSGCPGATCRVFRSGLSGGVVSRPSSRPRCWSVDGGGSPCLLR
jgi:hypothetical protein